MLELKFAISASLPSQASYAVLPEESQAFFKHPPHTNSISNSASLRNNYILLLCDLCACVHVKKNGVVKEAIVLLLLLLLFQKEKKKKKKKKKKEKHFGILVTFWFGTFAMLFSATGCVVRHENTRR